MHEVPAKAKCDRWTDGQTDNRQSEPYVPLCIAGPTTKIPKTRPASYLTFLIKIIVSPAGNTVIVNYTQQLV